MKSIALALAFLFLAVPAMAQTLVSKEKANIFYNSCSTQKAAEQFIGNGQQLMCACQAARMTQFFTMEDMNAMMSPDPVKARPALNKMLIDVYAPCMEEPTRAYHLNQCLSNPDTAKYGNAQVICPCMADAVGKYMATYGSTLIQEVLTIDPNNMDPSKAVYESPKFMSFAKSKLLGCVL